MDEISLGGRGRTIVAPWCKRKRQRAHRKTTRTTRPVSNPKPKTKTTKTKTTKTKKPRTTPGRIRRPIAGASTSAACHRWAKEFKVAPRLDKRLRRLCLKDVDVAMTAATECLDAGDVAGGRTHIRDAMRMCRELGSPSMFRSTLKPLGIHAALDAIAQARWNLFDDDDDDERPSSHMGAMGDLEEALEHHKVA